MSRFWVVGAASLHCRRRELWFADDLQPFLWVRRAVIGGDLMTEGLVWQGRGSLR